MNTPSTPFQDQPSELPPALASQGLRLLAYWIDFVFFATLVVALTLLLDDVVGVDRETLLFIFVVFFILTYSPLMTAAWGGTVGKFICRIRVVRIGIPDKYHDGNLGYRRALARHTTHAAMALTPILGVMDAMWCLWDKPNCQCLHDKVVKSAVIMR